MEVEEKPERRLVWLKSGMVKKKKVRGWGAGGRGDVIE